MRMEDGARRRRTPTRSHVEEEVVEVVDGDVAAASSMRPAIHRMCPAPPREDPLQRLPEEVLVAVVGPGSNK
jgi:hypothetical protein